MASWDNTMPVSVADGQLIDQTELNPLFNNVNWLRYATVFESGIRRTTLINSGTNVGPANEFEVFRTPAFTQENGYLYYVHGFIIWRPGATTIRPQLNLHQGAGLAGAFLPLTLEPASVASTNYGFSFSKYFKAVSTASQQYTVGMYKAAGASSSFNVQDESWMAVLRCGDANRMVDI